MSSGTTARKAVHHITFEAPRSLHHIPCRPRRWAAHLRTHRALLTQGRVFPPQPNAQGGAAGFASHGRMVRLVPGSHPGVALWLLRAWLGASREPSACSNELGEDEQCLGAASCPLPRCRGSESRRHRPARRGVGACSTNEASK